jgi:hypothetical protein
MLYSDFHELMKCVRYCENNKTLLRYFDLEEIVKFLLYVNQSGFIQEPYTIPSYFQSISDITMNSIKIYYLDVLKHLDGGASWNILHDHCIQTQQCKFPDRSLPKNQFRKIHSAETAAPLPNPAGATIFRQSSVVDSRPTDEQPATPPPNPFKGIQLTTTDAHTLTDGPTIYLVDDVDKIGKFYIQQTRIPDQVFKDIMVKIQENETLQKKMTSLEKTIR